MPGKHSVAQEECEESCPEEEVVTVTTSDELIAAPISCSTAEEGGTESQE